MVMGLPERPESAAEREATAAEAKFLTQQNINRITSINDWQAYRGSFLVI